MESRKDLIIRYLNCSGTGDSFLHGLLAGLFREKVRQRFPGNPAAQADRFAGFLDVDWKALLSRMNEREIEESLDPLVETPAEQPGDGCVPATDDDE